LFLYEQGYVTQEQLSIVQKIKLDEITMSCEVKQNYFKDIYDAIDFVQAVGSMFGMNDKDDLLIIKSIVILSWYGIEASAMSGIRKADLCPDSNSVCIDGGLTVVMPRECFSILYRLSVIDEYRGFPSGKKQTCVNSPYLFRTFRSEQTDRSKINQAVKRFNNEASDLFDRKIAVSALKNNRIFCQMLECEDQSSCGLTSLLKEVAGKDRHAAVWYKSMYKTWKDVYYPNGGGVV
jgi:hypothetical protein